MQAGKLKHAFYLLGDTDNYGNPVDPATTTSTDVVRCEILSQRAAAKVIAGGVVPSNTIVMRCRFRTGIAINQYLVHTRSSERFQVRGVENVEMANRELLITAERRQ